MRTTGGGGLVAKSCPTFATPGTVAHQAPLSMGFSSQEYWSGLHFLLQGTFPTQGWNLGSPAGGFFTTEWPVHTSFPDSSVGTESAYSQCRRPRFDSWVRTICWRGDGLPIPVFLGFACGSAGKESTCNAGALSSVPGLGLIPWRGDRLPAPVLWPGESHGVQSMGSQRAGNNGVTFTFFSQHILPGGSGGGRRGCSRDDSQTSDWGCWKPKIQLIEKEFRRESWWGVEVRW